MKWWLNHMVICFVYILELSSYVVLDPWKQAEAEWGEVEKTQYLAADEKLAQKLQAEDQ